MKNQKFSSIIITCFLISVVIFSTACDSSFYLTEKEFYALRSQIATEAVANQVFSTMQNGQLQITLITRFRRPAFKVPIWKLLCEHIFRRSGFLKVIRRTLCRLTA